jgi:MFS family permease
MITLDDILDEVGIGPYHYKMCIGMGLIMFNAGTLGTTMALIQAIIAIEYNLTNSELSILISTVFVGVMLGNVSSGYISDNFGRKPIAIYYFLFIIIFLLLTTLLPNFLLVTISFFFLAYVAGLGPPVSMCVVAETFPIKTRGKALTMYKIFFATGELLAVLLAWWLLDSMQ